MALVGEEGPELVYLNQGARVITHPETAKIMDKYNIPVQSPVSVESVLDNKSGTLQIDYKRMAHAFAEEMRNNPQVKIDLDKNGFSLHLLDRQSKVERLNNRYSA
jgi:hypothetical protein